MGFLDLYRTRKPEEPEQEVGEGEEEKPEPLPKISKDEFWPPSPRVKLLYIGLGFVIFNMILLCVFAYALSEAM